MNKETKLKKRREAYAVRKVRSAGYAKLGVLKNLRRIIGGTIDDALFEEALKRKALAKPE